MKLSMACGYLITVSRYRMYPTPAQAAGLLLHCAHARYIWNLANEQWSMWRRDLGPTPRFVEQTRQLAEARGAFDWLRAGSSTVQQQALRDFDQACRNYFAGTHGRPTWRTAGRHEGFRIVGPQAGRVEQLSGKSARVLIPKVGWVHFRLSRSLPRAKSYRINRDRAGRWHIAFAAVPPTIPPPNTGAIVGVDRGVTVSAALSTGELLNCPRLSTSESRHLTHLQRRLARAEPGSNRRRRVRTAIAKLHARATDRRKDWVEKLSTQLARRFDVIRVEDLKVAQLTRRPRPKPDPLRRGVFLPNKRRAKAGLNREILASAWGLLVRRLEDKAGGRVEKVNPAYTSQTCSRCGHCTPENRESQAFRCMSCGHRDHADINAAVNIAAGRAVMHVERAKDCSLRSVNHRSAP
ncbi:RNA-guided endonuclease InsQ/TnpB family protein [Kribbella sp. NPDC058693]|uniref:RNA-guided endonuclease InsQ/TnpB family protein n=1 Tax=Kribbella sp. NPDC058693 TaxID=3346602 RepID=UPI0036479136